MCSAGVCAGDPVVYTEMPCEDGICFTDVTAAAGITWTSTIPSVMMGAGGAFIDYDGDGRLDVLLGSEVARPTLYRNQGDGTFTDVTATAGLPVFQPSTRLMGVATADYDNDGDTDIYFLVWGENRLYRNEGNGTFVDVTASAGVGGSAWSTAAAFGDFDGDGDLDLYAGAT